MDRPQAATGLSITSIEDHSQYCEATGPVAREGFVAARVRAIQQGQTDVSSIRSHSPMTPCPIPTTEKTAEPLENDIDSSDGDHYNLHSNALSSRASKKNPIPAISGKDQSCTTLRCKNVSESCEQWRATCPNETYLCPTSDSEKEPPTWCKIPSSSRSMSPVGSITSSANYLGEYSCGQCIIERIALTRRSKESNRPYRCHVRDQSMGIETAGWGGCCRSSRQFKHQTTLQPHRQSSESAAHSVRPMGSAEYYNETNQRQADDLSPPFAPDTADRLASCETRSTIGCLQSRHSSIWQQHRPKDQKNSRDIHTQLSSQIESEKNINVTEWQRTIHCKDHCDTRNGHPNDQAFVEAQASQSNNVKPELARIDAGLGELCPPDLRVSSLSSLRSTLANNATDKFCRLRRYSEPTSLCNKRSRADNIRVQGRSLPQMFAQYSRLLHANSPMQEGIEDASRKAFQPTARLTTTRSTSIAAVEEGPKPKAILKDPTSPCSRTHKMEGNTDQQPSLAQPFDLPRSGKSHWLGADGVSNRGSSKLSEQTIDDVSWEKPLRIDAPTPPSQDFHAEAQKLRSTGQKEEKTRDIRRLQIIVKLVRE